MLIEAERLFRIDVLVRADTMMLVVRNLSGGGLKLTSPFDGYPGESVVFGEAASLDPSHSTIEFSLGQGADRVSVRADVGLLRFAQRGAVRVSGQAIVRESP